MADDEDSLSDAKRTNELEMENEKLEITGCVVECESEIGFGETGMNVDGGDGGRMVQLEDTPAGIEGRAVVSDLGNQIDVEESESNNGLVDAVGNFAVTEIVDQPGVPQPSEEPVVAEPIEQPAVAIPIELRVAVMVEQPIVLTEISMPVLEGNNLLDGKEEGVVSDKGDKHVLSESGEGTQGVDQPDGLMIEEKAEDVFAASVDTEHVNCFSDRGHAGVVEMLGPQPEPKAKEEFMPDVESEVGAAISDVDNVMQLPEFSLHELGNEPHASREEIDGLRCESERNLAHTGRIEDLGGINNGLADSWTVENEPNAVVSHDEIHKENVGHLSLEIGSAVNSTVFYEKTVGCVFTGEFPAAEETTPFFAVSEHVQVQMLGRGIGHSSELVQHKDRDGNDASVSKIKILEDEDSNVEKAYNLDENVNDVETEYAATKEEPSSGNIKTETDVRTESQTRDDSMLEEIQSADAEVGTDMGNKVEAREMRDKDGKMEIEETASDVDELGQGSYDSPSALQDEEDETMAVEEETGTQDTEMETETDGAESGKSSVGKRKRGKFSKSPNSKAIAKSSSRKTIGEDVCFICFDGGELVLCDRRGCPKAYHPSCVNRDEAFFRSKGRWNCGWHLCSICEKNARYMCYTCTFSLCKSCTKDAVILCIRGNKGFCETCMRTVDLIESNDETNKDARIDFDDKSSWEYLFKDYYTDLKNKLSLSSTEILQAKNPWKGADVTGLSRQESFEGHGDVNDGGSGSEDSAENVEPVTPKRRKVRKHSKSVSKDEELPSPLATTGNRSISLYDNADWASKELLEFVLHMKKGDVSVLSQFDVQALLLEYIKRNKLRDPRRKSQIICDARLQSLFGKPRVGHFEMLKLLESHFLVRDEQNDDVQGSVVDIESNKLDIDGNSDTVQKGVKDKKRKSRKKGERHLSNLDDYAAIDMHNIGLIYLRRKLMEDLLEDADNFHERVIGTFVRIRISGSNQKQDMYRLVQVVGTSKAAEPYKIGKRTCEIMVEILNLDKTEIISVDTISNQDFTEEECKRLRQSIKCGLINPLTVGVILDKAMELQAIKVNDWLESETLRLSHLRDRASDMGHRKELRECVEKLQLLKTPEERRRRLEEFPEIKSDPKMDPKHESEDNDSDTENTQQDIPARSMGSGLSRRGRGTISPRGDNSTKDTWNVAGKLSTKAWESGRHKSSNFSMNSGQLSEKVYENSLNLERDNGVKLSNNLEKLNSDATSESDLGLRSATRSEPFSVGTSLTSKGSISSEVVENTVKINESEKMWHYLDPSGKVQGPFSIVQLRKWNNTGYFPVDLKIWRATENQDAAMPLADALAGKFQKVLPAVDNMFISTNPLQSSHAVVGHSGWSSRASADHDKDISGANQHSGSSLSNLITEKLIRSVTGSLPSPTPRNSNVSWSAGEGTIQPPAANMGTQSSALASVLNSVVQAATFSPASKSQPVVLGNSSVSLLSQTASVSEPHPVQMPAHPPPGAQPIQTAITQSPQTENQTWGSGAQPVQPQGYNWGTPNVQNSSGTFSNLGTTSSVQPDAWGPTQGSQPPITPNATQNAAWGMGPAESSTMGVRSENSNVNWGQMQANPNMGWVNPVGNNTNMNWAPPPGNTPSGWVPPVGNSGANIQGMGPGNANSGANIQGMAPGNANAGANIQGMGPGNPNPGWAPPQGWGAPPAQGPIHGNGWGPPTGNAGPRPLQGPPQGSTNQNWAPPPVPQGSWNGEQNYGGGQFSGPRGGQGRNSGFNGGRPWQRQSSFGRGGFKPKRDQPCPYNANGRCIKGSRCDYLHV